MKQVSLIVVIYLICCSLNALIAQTTCDKMGFSNGWMLHMDDNEVNAITQACAQTHATYFRTDFAWSDVQWNGADEWEWRNIDRVVHSVNETEQNIIAILDYFPPWADVSTDTSFWYNFVYEAGMRYIPQGVYIWEIWNEPNIINFWPDPNVEDYVQRILKPGSNAIRAAAASLNQEVIVLTGGLAPAATDGTNISQLDFVNGIYNFGGKNYFDGLGQHPYCWPLDPSIENPYNWFLKTEELRNVMVINGDEDKLVWGTEMGWPTHSDPNSSVSELEQAEFLSKAYGIWETWSWTGPLIWYAYNDAGDDPSDPEDNFGLVDVGFNAKPALDSFLTIIDQCILSTSVVEQFNTIAVFPNPAIDKIIVKGLNSNSDVSLINTFGEKVKIDKSITDQHLEIDIQALTAGLYIVSINQKGVSIFKKVIIN